MANIKFFSNITLGNAKKAGHTVYPWARYGSTPIIYKKNKHNNPKMTLLEVAFGSLARLFLKVDLTPREYIVTQPPVAAYQPSSPRALAEAPASINAITGLAVDHIGTTIQSHETKNSSHPTFYTLLGLGNRSLHVKEVHTHAAEEIPYYFLHNLPPNFFVQLMQVNNVTIDYASLASVLACSYTLEEDDLHKGNFGFYIVSQQGKLMVKFVKIDNDLMMTDTIMSHLDSRVLNWTNSGRAFSITAEALRRFPLISDSYYWVTKKRYFAMDASIAYTDAECNAFGLLADNPQFIREKWLAFYKHILISPSRIEAQLPEQLQPKTAEDEACITLVQQAVVARVAKLRHVLFTLPEFRALILEMEAKEVVALFEGTLDATETAHVYHEVDRYQTLCQIIVPGDTPLHVAVRCGEFRYQESLQAFGSFINTKNDAEESPIDVAMKRQQRNIVPASMQPSSDTLLILQYLLKNGATPTAAYLENNFLKEMVKNRSLKGHPLVQAASQSRDFQELLHWLQCIGQDPTLALKMRKEMAVVCVQQYISHANNEGKYETLCALKKALNGDKVTLPAPELFYIRQLRSQLWIIRILRGLFGYTTTLGEMNHLIKKGLRDSAPVAAPVPHQGPR